MAKDILFDRDLWNKMMAGIEKVAGTVKVTLGPGGRNAIMLEPPGLRDASGEVDPSSAPLPGAKSYITNDGVTIARSLSFEDPFENMGASLLKEVAIRTNDEAGDGTTTSIILAEALLKEGLRNITAGAHPLAVKRGMTGAAEIALKHVRENSIPVKTRKEISQVASISCQNAETGDLVGEAFDKVGLEGVVSVDVLSRSGKTELDIQEGIVFERGYISEYMITNKETLSAELHDPLILITDHSIENPNDIIDIMIAAAEHERPLLIIAENIEKGALGIIVRNKREGGLDVVGIRPPMYGEGRIWRLEDLAVQTGGRFITKETGELLTDVKFEDLGSASYVKVTRNQTVINGAGGDPAAIEERVRQIRHLIENTDYEFNKERFKERLAKFISGVATIQAGGKTDVEIKENKLRIEDAINAARSAIEEGIVPGGGIALLNAVPAVREYAETLEGDEKTGALIVASVLERPCRQIAINAGLNAERVLAKVEDQQGIGFDPVSVEYVNMVERGIVDPAKVTRLALQSAISVASTMLTSGAGLVAVKN